MRPVPKKNIRFAGACTGIHFHTDEAWVNLLNPRYHILMLFHRPPDYIFRWQSLAGKIVIAII